MPALPTQAISVHDHRFTIRRQFGKGNRQMRAERWQTITKLELIGLGIGPIFLGLVLGEPAGFVFLLDHRQPAVSRKPGIRIIGCSANGWSRMVHHGPACIPVVLAVSFWRKGQALPFAAALIWFFENWLNIAHYMADARAVATAVGGRGDHDWKHDLSRWLAGLRYPNRGHRENHRLD